MNVTTADSKVDSKVEDSTHNTKYYPPEFILLGNMIINTSNITSIRCWPEGNKIVIRTSDSYMIEFNCKNKTEMDKSFRTIQRYLDVFDPFKPKLE